MTAKKKRLGEQWEAESDGKGLFLMAERQDELGQGVFDQIKAKIEGCSC